MGAAWTETVVYNMSMSNVPNVQDEEPKVQIPINRVGFKNIRIPAGKMLLNGLEIFFIPRFHISVDLPKDKRGVHASRIYGIVSEIVKEYWGKNVELEEIGEEIAKGLLKAHPYSSKAYVVIESSAYYKAEAPITKSTSYERFKIYVKVKAYRNSKSIKYFGVEVEGLTACPCAREVVKKAFPGADTTHMQRSRAKVILRLFGDTRIDLVDLLDIVKSSFSSPLYSYLKRTDEAKVVIDALESPKFAEDTLREIVEKIAQRWIDLPDDSEIYVSVESKESLHPQDIVAFIKLKLSDARNLLNKRV
ncbi:MAG: GTP cyclohydrolase MptA [Nitrososphaerota archaeon]